MQEECLRRGIDPSDIHAVREMVMGGHGSIYSAEDRTSNHPSQQVPRFGNDLGFSAKGVQVWPRSCKTRCAAVPCSYKGAGDGRDGCCSLLCS